VPVDAYRGAGRPEAIYLVERVIDAAARELKLAPDEIRRRNFIRTFPYQTPVALNYDTGNYDQTLDTAMQMADVAGFPARKAEAQRRGKLRGLGYASYIEACGLAPSNVAGSLGARAGLFEAGEVRVHPTGSVTVFTGSHSHGQGHETTLAQVVAARLGVPIENIDVVHGDTGRVPFGMGTYGSRSLAVGGTAIVKALDKVVAKGKKIAAHLLEAAETDIEFKDGKFGVAGTDRSKAFGEVALAAYVPHNYPLDKLEPGLNETAFYDPTNFTYPAGTHICEVEIDPDTGEVDVVAFTACDDFGNIINPMIVEGQVHGGVAQGLGQALLEQCLYDDAGQLHVVGHTSGFKAKEKRELLGFLEPYRTWERGSGEPSRWKSDEELVWEGLRPELVVEVAFDHITGRRIRHGAKFQRWRDDKRPQECTVDQLDR
jgi:carbon-monoxide dehydrogenase large subunit